MGAQNGGPFAVTQHPAVAVFALNDDRITQRVAATWVEALKRDPLMRYLRVVVDINFGPPGSGYRYLLSTEGFDTAGSQNRRVLGSLRQEPSLTWGLTVGQQQSQAKSAAVVIDLQVIDVLAILRSLSGFVGVGEVSLHWVDPVTQTSRYDDRIVAIRGGLGKGTRFGRGTARVAPGGLGVRSREVLDLEIVDFRSSMSGTFPPVLIENARFDSFPDESCGEKIPLIINGYRKIPAVRVTTGTTGPQEFAFALSTGWAIDEVRVNNVAKTALDAVYAWSRRDRYDKTGTPYQVIEFTVGATAWEDTDAVNVTVSLSTGKIKPLVRMIRYLLTQYSSLGREGVAEQLLGEAQAKLPSVFGAQEYALNVAVNGRSSFLDWFENEFLASFPMLHACFDRGRYGVVCVDQKAPVVASWIVGQGPLFSLESDYEVTGEDDVYNEFVLRYDYDPLLDIYRGVATRGRHNSALCDASDRAFGRRVWRDGDILSQILLTAGQAEAVLDWLVETWALPTISASYAASARVLIENKIGDNIALTDENIGWVGMTATIEQLSKTPAGAMVRLKAWDRGLLTGVGGAARGV